MSLLPDGSTSNNALAASIGEISMLSTYVDGLIYFFMSFRCICLLMILFFVDKLLAVLYQQPFGVCRNTATREVVYRCVGLCVFIRVDVSRVSVLPVECILRPFDIVDRYRLGAVRCR